MTREEAILHGKEQLEIFGGEHREFIKMAIKALEQENYNQTKADALIDINNRYRDTLDLVIKALEQEPYYKDLATSYEKTINKLTKAISEQEPKQGHWIDTSVFDINDTTIEQLQSCTCSNCRKILTTPYMYYFDVYNYCPNCGARMDEVEE